MEIIRTRKIKLNFEKKMFVNDIRIGSIISPEIMHTASHCNALLAVCTASVCTHG